MGFYKFFCFFMQYARKGNSYRLNIGDECGIIKTACFNCCAIALFLLNGIVYTTLQFFFNGGAPLISHCET